MSKFVLEQRFSLIQETDETSLRSKLDNTSPDATFFAFRYLHSVVNILKRELLDYKRVILKFRDERRSKQAETKVSESAPSSSFNASKSKRIAVKRKII